MTRVRVDLAALARSLREQSLQPAMYRPSARPEPAAARARCHQGGLWKRSLYIRQCAAPAEGRGVGTPGIQACDSLHRIATSKVCQTLLGCKVTDSHTSCQAASEGSYRPCMPARSYATAVIVSHHRLGSKVQQRCHQHGMKLSATSSKARSRTNVARYLP